jgi:Cu2+-exporting ATPase
MKKEIPISGMSCSACAVAVENTLKSSKGVKSVAVNYANHKAQLEWNDDEVQLQELKEKVKASGYDLLLEDISEDDLEQLQAEAYRTLKRKTLFAGILAFPVFLIGMFWMDMPYANPVMWALTTPVLFIFGRQIFIQAWKLAKLTELEIWVSFGKLKLRLMQRKVEKLKPFWKREQLWCMLPEDVN